MSILSAKNRDRFGIYATILESGRKPQMTRTSLMYLTMTSHDQIMNHLDALLRSGLMDYDGNNGLRGVTYKTTQKGEKFLQYHDELQRLMPDAKI